MPTETTPIWSILFILLDSAPFVFLQYESFRTRLRASYGVVLSTVFGLLLLYSFGFAWWVVQPWVTPALLLLYRLLVLVPLLACSCIFIRDSFVRYCYVFLLMIPLVYLVNSAADLLYRQFFALSAPAEIKVLISLRLVLVAVCLSLFYPYLKTYLSPAVAVENIPIWQYVWPVPLILSALSLLLDSDGTLPIFWARVLIFLCCIALNQVLVHVLREVKSAARMEEEIRQSQKLLMLQQEQYSMLSANIEQVKQARHDLRHHMGTLAAMVEHSEFDRLSAYLHDYRTILPLDTELLLCENYAANSILQYYLQLAKQELIEVHCTLQIPQNLTITDVDLSILLGNCMENAIEACRHIPAGSRFIQVGAAVTGGYWSLTMDNSFDGNPLCEGGRYLSVKRGGKEEGIGITSVEAIVRRYNGVMHLHHDANIFSLSLLLQCD